MRGTPLESCVGMTGEEQELGEEVIGVGEEARIVVSSVESVTARGTGSEDGGT